MDTQRDVHKEIESLLQKSKVVLFMKGVPAQPACGFSAKAVSILKANGLNFEDFLAIDVLDDQDIRDGVKKFSSWPTVPQLYVNGEFIGGSDIMTELHNNGEIKKVLA